jgi:hypothetical protein
MDKTLKMGRKVTPYKLFFKLNSGDYKHLAIVPNRILRKFDEIAGGCLGSHISRKIRPCIFWKSKENSKECYKIVFLTTSRFTPIAVDLNNCVSLEKNCPYFKFSPKSYVIFSSPENPVCLILKSPKEQLEGVIHCGICRDLEFLDKL